MPNWIIKSATQRVISWLPNSQYWNGLFQKWVTRSTGMTHESLRGKLEEAAKILKPVRDIKGPGAPFNAFEVGTGWYPTIPIALFLCGSDQVWTTDIDPLLNRDRLQLLVKLLLEMADADQVRSVLPDAMPDRIETLRKLQPRLASDTAEAWLAQLGIHVLDRDARTTGLPDGSVDLFFSSGVLEYIPKPILAEVLRESARIASPEFASIHRLNLVDQFSYFDPSITAFNYLKFSPREWAWANSPLIWQNRLRISDYRELFAQEGFVVTDEDNILGDPADLATVPLAPEFRHYSQEDLLVLHSYITARKKLPA